MATLETLMYDQVMAKRPDGKAMFSRDGTGRYYVEQRSLERIAAPDTTHSDPKMELQWNGALSRPNLKQEVGPPTTSNRR